jgi:hypothetical protein
VQCRLSAASVNPQGAPGGERTTAPMPVMFRKQRPTRVIKLWLTIRECDGQLGTSPNGPRQCRRFHGRGFRLASTTCTLRQGSAFSGTRIHVTARSRERSNDSRVRCPSQGERRVRQAGPPLAYGQPGAGSQLPVCSNAGGELVGGTPFLGLILAQRRPLLWRCLGTHAYALAIGKLTALPTGVEQQQDDNE